MCKEPYSVGYGNKLQLQYLLNELLTPLDKFQRFEKEMRFEMFRSQAQKWFLLMYLFIIYVKQKKQWFNVITTRAAIFY